MNEQMSLLEKMDNIKNEATEPIKLLEPFGGIGACTQAFTIKGNPATKKNHSQVVMRGKHPMLIPSKQYQDYEKRCKGQIPELHIDNPCNVKAIYYMPTRRRVDISNLHSALHDVLVKYGCLVDDNCKIVAGTDGSRVRYDKENPRTEVEISYGEEYVNPFE